MKFSKIIGKIPNKLIEQAENKLSQVFVDLGIKYTNKHIGTGLGGDPLIFTLMYPVEHVCTLNMPTAATDGKRYYWNPKFVLKQSKIGLRIICAHEAWHALYMHPNRRGSRLPKLWNIAVDYIVNGTIMDDFKARDFNGEDMFSKHLGKYMTLTEYAELLKNPFKALQEDKTLNATPSVTLPSPDEDRDLTPEEIKELENREKAPKFYFADPNLKDEMKSPEKIYDYLYMLLPKCPKCGSIGIYKLPKDKDKKKQNNKGPSNSSNQKGTKGTNRKNDDNDQDEQNNQSGQGDQKGNGDGEDCSHGCGSCGSGIDIFDLGGTVDDHMDTQESEEKLAKRISEAMDTTRKMAGVVPSALEDELGKLTAPKITWQDIIRARLYKARAGNGKNDWTRFRSRPMFTGMLVPKRRDLYAHFGCLLDTSGSMSKDDMSFGLSQLCALDERSEGTIVPADAEIYWDEATKVKKCNPEEIGKVKVMGRGGTMYAAFFDDYKENIGVCDFLVIITDGWLLDSDIANMKNPGIDVLWLITSTCSFKAPFGRVFDLRNS